MFEFKINNTYKKSRTGFFDTPHGKLETPNLAIVATHGKIKLLDGVDQKRASPDLTISNTFHLFVNKKVAEIKKAGGLHKWSGFKNPMMTDSGGFQVFSLGWGKVYGVGKVMRQKNLFYPKPAQASGHGLRPRSEERAEDPCLPAGRKRARHAGRAKRVEEKRNFSVLQNLVKISEEGVVFNSNSKKYELSPEKSMKIQKDLGADIIFAFDECTSPLHSYTYTKEAMDRTHRWASRCLKTHNLKLKTQALFGIVQGGIYEDLRKKSSKFIGALPFEGFGIGGSFGEKEMRKVLGWALSGLPIEKPRHLLGIGKIKNIFMAVRQGIDLFDCVVPTREARHGVLYTKAGKLNIEKGIFSQDNDLIEPHCKCWVCRQKVKRKEIYHYFKARVNVVNISVNPLLKGQKLATIHNIYFFKNLFREIRSAIVNNKLEKLEKEYYNYL